MNKQKERITFALLVLSLGVLLSSCTSTKTYEVTKKDGTKEHIEASYFTTEGAYVNFYMAWVGWVKTIQANEIKQIN